MAKRDGWMAMLEQEGPEAAEEALRESILAESLLVSAAAVAGPDFCISLLRRMKKFSNPEDYLKNDSILQVLMPKRSIGGNQEPEMS